MINQQDAFIRREITQEIQLGMKKYFNQTHGETSSEELNY